MTMPLVRAFIGRAEAFVLSGWQRCLAGCSYASLLSFICSLWDLDGRRVSIRVVLCRLDRGIHAMLEAEIGRAITQMQGTRLHES